MERVAITLLACAATVLAQPRLTARFSGPGPGTVAVTLQNGNIDVQPGTGSEVIVTPSWQGASRSNDNDTVEVRERNNVVEISLPERARAVNLTIQVPERATLRLKTVNGSIAVAPGAAEVDAETTNGTVRINDPAGGVVAHSLNGNVQAAFSRWTGKPMSFSTVNGRVDVALPSDAKARLRLKNQNGGIESEHSMTFTEGTVNVHQQPDGSKRLQSNTTIYALLNGGGPDIAVTTMNGQIRIRKSN